MEKINTVTGTCTPDELGRTLVHEHLLVGQGEAQAGGIRHEVLRQIVPGRHHVPAAGALPGAGVHFVDCHRRGGALVPLMCVDKTPEELDSFATLLAESQQFELPYQPWRLVFTAALSGSNGQAPTSEDAESPLERMVEAIKRGEHGSYIPFDAQGQAVQMN